MGKTTSQPILVEEVRTFHVSDRDPVATPESETSERTEYIHADRISVRIESGRPVQVEVSGLVYPARTDSPIGYRSAKYDAIFVGESPAMFKTPAWVAEIANWAAGADRRTTNTETVPVPVDEYLRLLRSDFSLDALRAAGVDNWAGYSEADWGAVDDGIAGVRAGLGLTASPR